MKKLIDDEMSTRPSSRLNRPSIVARLMGVDVLPQETKSTLYPIEKLEEPARTNSSYNEEDLKSRIVQSNSNSNLFVHEFNPVHEGMDLKLKRREHPQEEELQKFKKEFKAWQAARFEECLRYAETQNASAGATKEKSVELKSHLVKVKSAERSCSGSYGEKLEIYAAEQKEFSSLPCRNRYQENKKVPTTIVVLKPGPDRIWSSEDSLTSFSGSSAERGSIEDLLEEVREKLKHELQGRILQKGPIMCENRIADTVNEKPQFPQRITKDMCNQIRESVRGDSELGSGLVRSESTRSHRSDIQLNKMGSPEVINRDMRRFLAERLKNVLKRESDINNPVGLSRNISVPCFFDEKQVSRKQEEIAQTEEENEEENEEEIHTRQGESLSPKNLVRSLSAPVYGTSFRKLLLEDRHVITGAHIRRKHEHSIENLFASTKKGKKEKERFSLREKVYNLRSAFTLRGRLFRKRMSSLADFRTCEPSFMKDIMDGPTVILNRGERYENSTEVPPSPASVCSSSTLEEFWRPSNDVSPASSPETTSQETFDETHVFREITPTCKELQRHPSQSNSERAVEGDGREHELVESKLTELEDRPVAFVRALLIASGLYDGLSDPYTSRLRLEPSAKPIATSVYEGVKESYKQREKDEGGHGLAKDDNGDEVEIGHRVLYDLSNEALSHVLRRPVFYSRFRNKISVPSGLQQPNGSRLMDSVWIFIRSLVYPPADVSMHYYSLESIVARDLGSAPWFGLLDEQVDAIGAEIEGSILGDLIGEIVRDIELR